MNQVFTWCRCALSFVLALMRRTVFRSAQCGRWAAAFVLPLVLAYAATATDWYVDGGGGDDENTGINDWEFAFKTLQKAIESAQTDDRIFVSTFTVASETGAYYPDDIDGTSSNDRDDTFTLDISGLQIYGGFDATNADYDTFGEQDPVVNPTILSGDIDGDDSAQSFGDSDNSYHVVTATPTTAQIILNGFIITGGVLDQSAAADWTDWGAGIIIHGDEAGANAISPLIQNCVIEWNKAANGRNGAGIGVHQDEATDPVNPIFRKCTIRNNDSTTGRGGGAATWTTSPFFVECDFLDNEGSISGGAISIEAFGEPQIINCRFLGNHGGEGGAIYAFCTAVCDPPEDTCAVCEFFPEVTVLNSLIASNTASSGGGIFSQGAHFRIVNSTIANNAVSGNGGGYYQVDNSFIPDPSEIVNSILYDNTNGEFGSGPQIYLPTFFVADLSVDYSAIEGGEAAVGGPFSDFDYGDNNKEPATIRFHNPAGEDSTFGTLDDDYRLSCNSDAVDTGDNTTISDSDYADVFNLDGDSGETATSEPTPDLDLADRIFDGDDDTNVDVDMGAYEYHCDTCLADLDENETVGFQDLLILLDAWGTSDEDADLDESGTVGFADLLILLDAWGPCGVSCTCAGTDECEPRDLGEECEGMSELLDIINNGTAGEKANAECWLEHYINDHLFGCNVAPDCPDDDPLEGSHL